MIELAANAWFWSLILAAGLFVVVVGAQALGRWVRQLVASGRRVTHRLTTPPPSVQRPAGSGARVA